MSNNFVIWRFGVILRAVLAKKYQSLQDSLGLKSISILPSLKNVQQTIQFVQS